VVAGHEQGAVGHYLDVDRPAPKTITKRGLCRFPLLTHFRLHPRVPATKCRAEIIIYYL